MSPLTVGAGKGPTLSVVGDTYSILLSGEQTNNVYSIIEMSIPPGGGPGPHAHSGIWESFYVLEGEIMVKSEFGTYQAKKGALVTIPKGGVVHYFRNNTHEIARLLCIVVPAGLDAFFQEIGQPAEYGTFLPPPSLKKEDMEKLEAIATRYGQQLFPPDYLD